MTEASDTGTTSEIQPETTPSEPDGKTQSKLVRWLGNFVLGGALLAIVVVLISTTLARFDIIDKLTGFIPFFLAVNPARALALIGLLGLAYAFWRKLHPRRYLILGSALSLALLFIMYTMLILPAGKVPPIHDISTDLDDMPQFSAIDVDNPVSTGPFSVEEWRAFHEEAYADIGPIVIDRSPTEVLAAAQALAEDRGWDIAAYDAEAGRLEATATAGYVRFYDDVLVEVTAVADGSTRVDMRSVSRVGVSDVGYNAARIRDFLTDLQAAS